MSILAGRRLFSTEIRLFEDTLLTAAMEIFMNLKTLLKYCGYIKFDNSLGSIIAYFLRFSEFLVVAYGFITTLWIVILTNEPILEKAKSLETAEALFYILALHFILTMWPSQFFDMIDIINNKIRERKSIFSIF